jgi:hypothetical protein
LYIEKELNKSQNKYLYITMPSVIMFAGRLRSPYAVHASTGNSYTMDTRNANHMEEMRKLGGFPTKSDGAQQNKNGRTKTPPIDSLVERRKQFDKELGLALKHDIQIVHMYDGAEQRDYIIARLKESGIGEVSIFKYEPSKQSGRGQISHKSNLLMISDLLEDSVRATPHQDVYEAFDIGF